MSVILYVRNDGTVGEMVQSISRNLPLLAKYFVPASLYCAYNNLVYVNLAIFDPGTYNVLMQLKIVLTGVTYQLVFSKMLNRNQWLALMLITFGCILKEVGKLSGGLSFALEANAWGWFLLLVQFLSSVFAGVYNEALLKGAAGEEMSTNLQNAFMASQSILCNSAVIVFQGKVGEVTSPDNFSAILRPTVLAIIAIMASVGIVTGFFLKHLDSVRKAIASALEVVFTMILGYVMFGVPLTVIGVTSACIVGGGVALYSRPTISLELSADDPAVIKDVELEQDRRGADASEMETIIGKMDSTREGKEINPNRREQSTVAAAAARNSRSIEMSSPRERVGAGIGSPPVSAAVACPERRAGG